MLLPSLGFLITATICGGFAAGQEAPSPELKAILERVETNRQFYSSHIPDFFCSEHVVSREDYGRHLERKQVSVTDSIFHLTRVDTPNQPQDLIESRSQMQINGSPSARTELKGPVVLSNVFSRGLDTVSLSQMKCARYSLEAPAEKQPAELENVHFESIGGRQRSQDCTFAEYATGSVLFDTHVQQVTRLTATIPRHLIAPPDYFGRWDLSVEYGPVSLGDHTYWMPLQITSRLTPLEDDDAVWSFSATYGDFHKYEVKSRIVP